MTDFDDTMYDEDDEDVAAYEGMGDDAPAGEGRFVRISEDVVVDVLTGNQYMPAR